MREVETELRKSRVIVSEFQQVHDAHVSTHQGRDLNRALKGRHESQSKQDTDGTQSQEAEEH